MSQNMTTRDYSKGVTNLPENDLNNPKPTNTMNGITGLVNKNTLVRWFLTNDEPWTTHLASRTLNAKANELCTKFNNGASVNLRMKDSIEFDIVHIRRKMEVTSTEDRSALECGVCMETRDAGIPHMSFACQVCNFQTCYACQIKTVERKGFLQCPGCRHKMWGQDWFVDVLEREADHLVGFTLPQDHVFIQHFHEERELSMWARTRVHLLEFLKDDLRTPPEIIEPFADLIMGQAYELCKTTIVPSRETTPEQYLKNMMRLIEKVDTIKTTWEKEALQGKPHTPPIYRKPTPERFRPYDADDMYALAKRVFDDWFTFTQ
jgi:hypothetical protein